MPSKLVMILELIDVERSYFLGIVLRSSIKVCWTYCHRCIVIDVNNRCHYVVMMSWYEQSAEESTYRLGEVVCKKCMYRRTNKVQGIKEIRRVNN
jgi:hypothetical protein